MIYNTENDFFVRTKIYAVFSVICETSVSVYENQFELFRLNVVLWVPPNRWIQDSIFLNSFGAKRSE